MSGGGGVRERPGSFPALFPMLILWICCKMGSLQKSGDSRLSLDSLDRHPNKGPPIHRNHQMNRMPSSSSEKTSRGRTGCLTEACHKPMKGIPWSNPPYSNTILIRTRESPSIPAGVLCANRYCWKGDLPKVYGRWTVGGHLGPSSPTSGLLYQPGSFQVATVQHDYEHPIIPYGGRLRP